MSARSVFTGRPAPTEDLVEVAWGATVVDPRRRGRGKVELTLAPSRSTLFPALIKSGKEMKNLLAAIVCASGLVVPIAVSAQSLSQEEVRTLALEAVRQQPDLVLKIILDNPEVVMQAIEILRERDETEEASRVRAALEGQRELLFNDPNAPVSGNPDGDITIIEFFDYNC
ncbi:MAG: hypothetical protein AAF982_10620, partial [Pseudomonadota bacterium]